MKLKEFLKLMGYKERNETRSVYDEKGHYVKDVPSGETYMAYNAYASDRHILHENDELVAYGKIGPIGYFATKHPGKIVKWIIKQNSMSTTFYDRDVSRNEMLFDMCMNEIEAIQKDPSVLIKFESPEFHMLEVVNKIKGGK